MVDKVKPLKIEHSTTGGTEDDLYPTEVDVLEDYISGKGFSFEGLDTFLLKKLGKNIFPLVPDRSCSVSYLSNGEIDYIEIFNGIVQTTVNRIIRIDMTYDVNIDPSTEIWSLYDVDGTTVLITVTYSHTFVNSDYIKTESSTT